MDGSFVGASCGNNSMASSAVNTGGFLLNTNGPSRGMHGGSFDGGLTNGGQQSLSNFSMRSSGNNLISSMGAQKMASQMMPTPGYNNSNSTTNQSYVNLESSTTVAGLSSVDSLTMSQPLQQKQQMGCQSSRILHSLGSHMGGGIRSTFNQKAYGFLNGSLNGNMGTMGNNLQMNGFGTFEGFSVDSQYGNTSIGR